MSVLNNVRDSVNISLSGISSMMRALLSDGNITALSNKDQYAAEDYKAMDEIQSTLSMSLLSNAYIDDILIYFHKADFILSSKSYLGRLREHVGVFLYGRAGCHGFCGADRRRRGLQPPSGGFQSRHGGVYHRPGTSISGKNNVVSVLVRLKTGLLEEMIVSDDCRTFLGTPPAIRFQARRASGFQGRAAHGRWKGRRVRRKTAGASKRRIRFFRSATSGSSRQRSITGAFLRYACCSLRFWRCASAAGFRSPFPPPEEATTPCGDPVADPQPGDDQDSDDYMVIRSSLTGLLQKPRTMRWSATTGLWRCGAICYFAF